MDNNTITQLYSELELSTPDLSTLAARCNLLTEILVDCDSLPQTQPVCRCLAAYLDAFSAELAKSMTDFRVLMRTISRPCTNRSGCWTAPKPSAITAGP
ncbi:hypothetical protein [Leclercia adecarboxylata]|uniref:hypothetical protein n=1 Tax=Leclercia adecarboxylata TaxID=83655 RepID=UPI002FD3718E